MVYLSLLGTFQEYFDPEAQYIISYDTHLYHFSVLYVHRAGFWIEQESNVNDLTVDCRQRCYPQVLRVIPILRVKAQRWCDEQSRYIAWCRDDYVLLRWLQ